MIFKKRFRQFDTITEVWYQSSLKNMLDAFIWIVSLENVSKIYSVYFSNAKDIRSKLISHGRPSTHLIVLWLLLTVPRCGLLVYILVCESNTVFNFQLNCEIELAACLMMMQPSNWFSLYSWWKRICGWSDCLRNVRWISINRIFKMLSSLIILYIKFHRFVDSRKGRPQNYSVIDVQNLFYSFRCLRLTIY